MKHLEEVGVETIAAQLNQFIAVGKDLLLCCYEDVRAPNQHCHITLFADWWFEKTGQKITELHNPAPIKFK